MNQGLIPYPVADVMARELSGDIVLVSPEMGRVRVLNEVGAAVWRLLDGKNSVACIESQMVQQYNVSREQVQQDLTQFLEELDRQGLLQWKPAL